MLKILIDNKPSLNSDVRRLFSLHEKRREDPLVAGIHAAVVPEKCGYCGNTFWRQKDHWISYCSASCKKNDSNSDVSMIGFG